MHRAVGIVVFCLASALALDRTLGAEAGQPSPAPAPAGAAGGPRLSAGVAWPRFLGPTGDGKSPERGLLTAWDAGGPPVAWHREVGTGYGIGAVANGRYFHFDRHADQARLTCLDSRTGRFVWQFQYSTDFVDIFGRYNGPRCSPVIDDGLVYLFGAEGLLHAVSAQSGQLVWKVDTAKKFGVVPNFFGVGSHPVVDGDRLIVMIGGSPPESQNLGPDDLARVVGNGTGIVAFDKRTGAVRYALSNELASYATPQLATIDGRRWCFAFCRGGLVGFDPRSGQVDFHYPWRAPDLASVNISTPVVSGKEVFISEAYGPGSSLVRVRPGAGEVVWCDSPDRKRSMLCYWNTPILHDGYLYGSSGQSESSAQLRCVEWKTGRVMWSQPRLKRTALLYVDGHFVGLSEDGMLRLIQATPERYRPLAEVVVRAAPDGPPLIKAPAFAAPILAHGLLYVRGRDRVVCLRLPKTIAEPSAR